MEECEHQNISWDDAPDYEGCRGMCLRWFGTCVDCGERVHELWEPAGLRDSKGERV